MDKLQSIPSREEVEDLNPGDMSFPVEIQTEVTPSPFSMTANIDIVISGVDQSSSAMVTNNQFTSHSSCAIPAISHLLYDDNVSQPTQCHAPLTDETSCQSRVLVNYEPPYSSMTHSVQAVKSPHVSINQPSDHALNDPIIFLSKNNPSVNEKIDFVLLGPLQPLSLQGEYFVLEKYYYEKINVGSIEVQQQRTWLTYSPALKKVFCSVCLVFGNKKDVNTLREGFDNMVNLSHSINKHCKQRNHRKAAEIMTTAMCGRDIKSQLLRQTEEDLTKRRRDSELLRDYLKRIIDAIRYQCSESLPRRGDNERNFYTQGVENPYFQEGAGKFLNLINLLSIYDETLRTKLMAIRDTFNENIKGLKGRGKRLTFLSNDTQDKLTMTMASLVRKKIAQEVNMAIFFSLSVDGTTDITLCEQLAIVVRYVIRKDDQVHANERMIDLKEAEETTGEHMETIIKKSLQENDIILENCVGISCDGASNNQGPERGVIARLKKTAKMAINVYCSVHGSNLVNKKCCRSSIESVNIYGTDSKPGEMQRLKTFFYGNARKRNQVFQRHKENSLKESVKNLELASTHDIRFTALHTATDRLLQLYDIVLSALEEILSATTDKFDVAVRTEAKGLHSKFSKFTTLLTLCLFDEIFSILGPLNKILQARGIDLSITVAAVDLAESKLLRLRDTNGVQIIQNAIERASELGFEDTNFKSVRAAKRKACFSYETFDERLGDPKERWTAEVFLTAVDTAIMVLKEKFTSQRSVLASLSVLLPVGFATISRENAEEKLGPILRQFALESDHNAIVEELVEFTELCNKLKPALVTEPKQSTFLNTYQHLISHRLDAVYPKLSLLYQILATIPSSSAECERCFSKLKLIKNRLANRLTSEHLSDRLILSVENDILWQLNYEDILHAYADTDELKEVLYP